METFCVAERYGVVWVTGGDPAASVPEFPVAEEPGFRTVLAGPYRFRAQGPRVIENLLDVAHLGFVHAGLLANRAEARSRSTRSLPELHRADPRHGRFASGNPTPTALERRGW